MYRSNNVTGVYRLKIANIDKLYIFNMQLFIFLYMGIFFDTTLRELLHCYIVTFAFSETHEKGVKKWSKNSIYKYIYLYILFFESEWSSFLQM